MNHLGGSVTHSTPLQPTEAGPTTFDDQYENGYAAAWAEKQRRYQEVGCVERLYPMTARQMVAIAERDEISFMPPDGWEVTEFTYTEMAAQHRGTIRVEGGVLVYGSATTEVWDLDDTGAIIKVSGIGPGGELGIWYMDLPGHFEVAWD